MITVTFYPDLPDMACYALLSICIALYALAFTVGEKLEDGNNFLDWIEFRRFQTTVFFFIVILLLRICTLANFWIDYIIKLNLTLLFLSGGIFFIRMIYTFRIVRSLEDSFMALLNPTPPRDWPRRPD